MTAGYREVKVRLILTNLFLLPASMQCTSRHKVRWGGTNVINLYDGHHYCYLNITDLLPYVTVAVTVLTVLLIRTTSYVIPAC